jgi:hypothetical protein
MVEKVRCGVVKPVLEKEGRGGNNRRAQGNYESLYCAGNCATATSWLVGLWEGSLLPGSK